MTSVCKDFIPTGLGVGAIMAAKKIEETEDSRELAGDEDVWILRLYVAGQTQSARKALNNLKKICEQHLAGRYRIEVVDLLENPQLGEGDQILAVPTVVRQLPAPVRHVIGDLSNTERTLVGLDLRPA